VLAGKLVGAPRSAPARLALPGLWIVIIGTLVGLASAVAGSSIKPPKLAFALGGLALLIPTMAVKDSKAFWLFLLVLSMPFDISKWMTAGIASPRTLAYTYGMPASETITFELFLTDVLLLAMLLPWLARVCLKKETVFFPRIGYLFILYCAWALIVSLVNAESKYLSIIELCREALYFLSFVYLINNVTTRTQLRSIIVAVLLGLIIGAGSVIAYFEEGIGTETVAFTSLRDLSNNADMRGADNATLTLHNEHHSYGPEHNGKIGLGSEIKRSQGIFRHPAIPASLCGLTLPIVLAYLIAARTNRDRILLFAVLAWGFIGLLLTFSRAGMFGVIVGIVVAFALAGWSRLISRRALKIGAVALTFSAALAVPLLGAYINTRPGTFYMRFNIYKTALGAFWEHPILGVGLNNSTAAMRAGKQELRDEGIQIPAAESADDYYLVVLMELGPVGFLLLFGFFGKIVMIALHAIKVAPLDRKPLLVGIVGGLTALATQNLTDDALAGHVISAILWLFAALVVVLARAGQANGSLPRIPLM
jgi:hypothetical protein